MLTIFRPLVDDLIEWRQFWSDLSGWQKTWPALYGLCYLTTIAILGGITGDHFFTTGLFVIPCYLGRRSRRVGMYILPFALTVHVYDSMRYYNDFIRGTVHVDDIYHFEKNWFGIDTPEGRLTPNEYLQKHTHWILDFFTGLAYILFAVVFMVQGIYYRFRWAMTDSQMQLAGRFAWSFFFVNILGYTTYYWFPAAPPWYVSDYGLGPANMEALPSAAGAARFDELLGVTVFKEMYGRSNDVFGAIPSLHVAYPFLAMLYSFVFKSLRIFSILFFILMTFSAVYLNHHYLLDAIWGCGYALIIFFFLYRKKDDFHVSSL